jgi:hypothetical protein
MWIPLASLILSAPLFACGGGDANQDPIPDPYLNRTHAEVLAWFGIRTDLGPRLGPDGNELPADFHPLRRPRATLGALAELYVGLDTSQGGGLAWVSDDSAAGGMALYTDTTEYMDTGSLPRAGKGDIYGDNRDAIVIVFYNVVSQQIWLHTVAYRDGLYSTAVSPLVVGVQDHWRNGEWLWDMSRLTSMAIGDLDDDGDDEIADYLFDTFYV